MKKLSWFFGILAVLLSDVMCARVAYNYCDIQWGIRYAGYSAPTYVAFVLGIPFAIAIGVCAILAIVFGKKAKRS